VVNCHKPHVQTPVVSHYPAPALVHDFVLLFFPPCGPHLTPLATGSLELSLLVSPLLEGPARNRHFALALHLHQRKSSRNLHLQYSATSQCTPCSQERPSTSPRTLQSSHVYGGYGAAAAIATGGRREQVCSTPTRVNLFIEGSTGSTCCGSISVLDRQPTKGSTRGR
jgi:hypothetical protein